MSKEQVSYKVTYFDARGGGEIIRLTLVAAGQPFEDNRVSREEWPKLKEKCPMKQMPLLTVKINGKEQMFCQSGASARFIAKKYGMFGSTETESYLVDEVYECHMDVQREVMKIYFAEGAAKDEAEKKFKETTLPNFCNYVKERKKTFGSENYIIGNKISLADVAVFNFVNQAKLIGKGAWLDDFPEMTKHESSISSNKEIAAWLAKRPKTDI